MSVTVSGWCSPAPGTSHTAAQHKGCRSRVCGCEAFGGHEKSPNEAQLSGSERSACDNGTARTGALTPAGPDHQPELAGRG